MDKIHDNNIIFLRKYLKESNFNWINYDSQIDISYFSSGGGTNLYLIKNGDKKFLARINFFPGKNDWKVKRAEFETLEEIEHLKISPRAYVLNENNDLNQDLTIVEYIEGKTIINFSKSDIIFLANDLKKLHSFDKKYDKKEILPYRCSIYNEFSNGEDKKNRKL